MSLHKNSNGKSWVYQTYTYFGSDDGNKIRVAKSLGMITKKEAQQKAKNFDEEYRRLDKEYERDPSKGGSKKPPNPYTKVKDRWLKDCEQKVKLNELSPTTFRHHKSNIGIFTDWYLQEFGNRRIERIDTQHIEQYRIERSTQSLSPNTISINLRTVRTFLKWCVEKDYIENSPFTDDIKIPKYVKRTDEDIPQGETWKSIHDFICDGINNPKSESKVIENFNDSWLNHVLFIMCKTAMRGGEVLRLKWNKDKDDQPNQRKPYSYLSHDLSEIHIFSKGTYGRIPINDELKSFFVRLKESKRGRYVFTPPNCERPYDKSRFGKKYREIMRELGYVDSENNLLYTAHTIRHAVVTDLLRKGVNMYDISKLCRHSSIKTTMDIYGHLQPSDLISVMDKIGRA